MLEPRVLGMMLSPPRNGVLWPHQPLHHPHCLLLGSQWRMGWAAGFSVVCCCSQLQCQLSEVRAMAEMTLQAPGLRQAGLSSAQCRPNAPFLCDAQLVAGASGIEGKSCQRLSISAMCPQLRGHCPCPQVSHGS